LYIKIEPVWFSLSTSDVYPIENGLMKAIIILLLFGVVLFGISLIGYQDYDYSQYQETSEEQQ